MSWGEALRLTKILRADPSSMLAAVGEGWEYPVSRTDLILMDQYDLTYAATGAKNRKPYRRPFKVSGESSHRGKPVPRSQAIERLRRVFKREIPD